MFLLAGRRASTQQSTEHGAPGPSRTLQPYASMITGMINGLRR